MTPENYDPNTNESGDSYQSSHPYGVPEGQRPGPYQHYQQQPPVQPPRRTGSQALAAASMVMAICSFLFMLNMGSLFFGSLGVIFALLSRGAGRMSGTAKAGLAGCTIGIIFFGSGSCLSCIWCRDSSAHTEVDALRGLERFTICVGPGKNRLRDLCLRGAFSERSFRFRSRGRGVEKHSGSGGMSLYNW